MTSAQRAAIAGRVLDKQRRPVVDATVHFTALPHPELPPGVAWVLGDDSITSDAKSDARGLFRRDADKAGAFEVYAQTDDGRFSARVFPVVHGDFVELTLDLPHRFAGVVTDERGTPVAGALVRETMHLGERYARETYARACHPIETHADAHGRFELPALDGGHPVWGGGARTVTASVDGKSSGMRLYRVDGQDLIDLDLRLAASEASAALLTPDQGRLPPGDAPLELRAVTGDAPCARRRVLVAVPDPANVTHAWIEHTDDDGVLAVQELRNGQRVEAWIERDGCFVPLFATTAGPAARDLGTVPVHAAARRLTGALRAEDGSPLIHAQLLFRGADSGFTHITYSDRSGRFALDGLTPGTGTLVVNAGFMGIAVSSIAADQRSFDLRLAAGTTVNGRAVLADGTPARDARIQFVIHNSDTPKQRFLPSIYLFGRADHDGRFTVRGIPEADGSTVWGMATLEGMSHMGFTSAEAGRELVVTLNPHTGRL